MIEKELAKLTLETIDILIAVFKNNSISPEEFSSHTTLKLRYLETYIKICEHDEDKDKIREIIQISKKIIGSKSYCL
jgi:hypothetical protein